MWNYLYFVMHLRKKPAIAYTAVEHFVHNQIKAGQISWYPIGQSLSLQAGREMSVRFNPRTNKLNLCVLKGIIPCQPR